MKRTLLALAAFCLLCLANCSKDDSVDDENEEPSLTAGSLAGNYKVTAIKGKAAALPETDVINYVLAPCEKDDILVLKADFTFQQKDEGVKCTPPGDETGTWSLNGNKIAAGPYEFTVTKWDGKDLVGTSTRTIEIAGVSQEATVTFYLTKQ
jgi:hypothetical protein